MVGIATINPFRYRGYYYDEEIGVYYLQSRYYDPAVGRFVNGDREDIIDNASDVTILSLNKFAYCLNDPINNSDEHGSIASIIIKMIGNFFFGMAGGMLGMYLGNVSLNVFRGKKNIYDKNDTWGKYVAEGVKSGAFAIFGNKLLMKIIAVVGAVVIKQIIDVFISKKSFNLWGMLLDAIVGILAVVLIHYGMSIFKKIPKKQRTSKFFNKMKSLINKIGKHITEKIKKFIKALFEFFKTFLKRFSISYAKKCAPQLLKVFR